MCSKYFCRTTKPWHMKQLYTGSFWGPILTLMITFIYELSSPNKGYRYTIYPVCLILMMQTKKSFMSIGGSVYWLHFTHAGRSANVHAPVFIKCSISYISTVMANYIMILYKYVRNIKLYRHCAFNHFQGMLTQKHIIIKQSWLQLLMKYRQC